MKVCVSSVGGSLLLLVERTAIFCRAATAKEFVTGGLSSGRLLTPLTASSDARRRRGETGVIDQRHAGSHYRNLRGDVASLTLSQECYQSNDCSPGLFTELHFWTQCEETPFSGGKTVCCKPFATPCDSDKACCSGFCSLEYTRCIEAATEALEYGTSSQDQDGKNTKSPIPTPIEEPSPAPTMAADTPNMSPTLAELPAATAGPGVPTASPSPEPMPATTADASASEANQTSADTSGYSEGTGDGSRSSVDDDGIGQDDEAAACEPDYRWGTIETIANSDDRVQTVAVDSKGNVFYSLGSEEGAGGDHIRRTGNGTCSGPASSANDTITGTLPPASSPSNVSDCQEREDELIYKGTGVILAMTVDRDDGIVFTMGDEVADDGALFRLDAAPGAILSSPGEAGSGSSTTNGTVESKSSEVGSSSESTMTGTGSISDGIGLFGAQLLVDNLGAFLPGVAVCPATGDIYVARGHAGLTRVVMDTNGEVFDQLAWSTTDMLFQEGDTKRAPLMVWDLAVDSAGYVYMTTYSQGVVLNGTFPRNGTAAAVGHLAGTWDSGALASSGDGGKAKHAEIAYPKGLAVDGDDIVYISEFERGNIRTVTPSGVISTCAGTGKQGNGGDNGPAGNASMDMPNDVALALGSVGGDMIIADFGNYAVRRVKPACL